MFVAATFAVAFGCGKDNGSESQVDIDALVADFQPLASGSSVTAGEMVGVYTGYNGPNKKLADDLKSKVDLSDVPEDEAWMMPWEVQGTKLDLRADGTAITVITKVSGETPPAPEAPSISTWRLSSGGRALIVDHGDDLTINYMISSDKKTLMHSLDWSFGTGSGMKSYEIVTRD